MKRGICLFVLVLLLAPPVLVFADENVDIWTQIYYETRTDAGRYQVALKILELRNKDFIPMLQKALDDLYNRRIDAGTMTEKFDKVQLARLLVQNLGNLNSTDSTDRVFAIYNETADPFLKSECALTLGKFRAKAFAYRLARDLSDINLGARDADTRPQEILAFGLVQALESLRDPGSFQALFLASVGWSPNNSRVKETARNALLKIFEDPTDQFAELIVKNADLRIKVAALEAETASKAPAQRKLVIARLALRQSLDQTSSQITEAANVKKLRALAIQQLVKLGDKSPESAKMFIELIGRDHADDASFDDTLQAFTALGYNASADAVAFLDSRLEYYNLNMRSGKNTPRDKMLVRELVAAIKRAASPDSKAVLFKSQYINEYDNAILQDIRDALAALGG
jgi:hypothetical protein